MKLSIVLSTQLPKFNALAYKGELEENIAKIKSMGYDGVELAVCDPKLLNVHELKKVLLNNSLPVSAIGTGQAYGEDGLSFTNKDVAIRNKAIKRIKSHIHLADNWGAVVIIGLIRGKNTSGISKKTTENMLIEALDECASENENIRLAIEPINRYETDIINTVDSGLRIVEKLNKKNIGLLLDTFHMNIEEPSIFGSIIAAKDRLFHFHIADSNRWYPGAGHIDFPSVMETLYRIGYTGYISSEILPSPNPDVAAKKTIENIKKYETILS